MATPLGRAVIYKDVVTGDELVSDAFDLSVVDDFFYEVDGKMILEGGDDIDIGGNAAEGEEEEGSEAVKVCNVVDSGRFQQTSFGTKDYVACYKAYMKVRPLGVADRPGAIYVRAPARCQESCQAPQTTNPDRVDGSNRCAPPPAPATPRHGRALAPATRRSPLLPATHRLPRRPSKRSLACGTSSSFTSARARRPSRQIILSFWKEGAEAPSFWFMRRPRRKVLNA